MAGPFYRFFTITAAILSVLLLVSLASPQEETKKILDQKAKQRLLEREAANALYRFQLRLKEEGFYSGRVALNIWRSTAIDAGTFEPELYNDFKKQLYEKSIADSLKCYEEFMLEENYYDANICLQIWRMHSKELGTYDPPGYEALKKKLTDARAAKAAGAKTTRKTQD